MSIPKKKKKKSLLKASDVIKEKEFKVAGKKIRDITSDMPAARQMYKSIRIEKGFPPKKAVRHLFKILQIMEKDNDVGFTNRDYYGLD